MKKTTKAKLRRNQEAMRRQHKNRMRSEKAKPFFDPWLEERFEDMKDG